MLHTIKEKTQRDSRLNPGKKIDYWVNFIEIDISKQILHVITHNQDSYNTLAMRTLSHLKNLNIEDLPQSFEVVEDIQNLKITFSNNIKESLNFLKEEGALSENTYKSYLDYISTLTNQSEPEEKSSELHPPSTTVKSSSSNSACLFSITKAPHTPPTPPAISQDIGYRF